MPTKKEVCQKEWKIASLETNLTHILSQLTEIKTDIANLTQKINTIITKFEQDKQDITTQFIKYTQKNYSAKWVEKIFIFIWWIIGTAIIWALLSTVLITK